MKTFNSLLTNITEAEDTPGGTNNRSAYSHFGLHRIEHPEQLQRVNSFLNAYMQQEFQDPGAAISGLRNKFNQIGLDFDYHHQQGFQLGEIRIPVSRFGGTFGTSPTHDLSQGFEKTDGLESPVSLNLNVSSLENGLYDITASLMSEGVEDPEEELEDLEGDVHEGLAGGVAGAVGGALAGGPLGAVAGGYLGHKVQQAAGKKKKPGVDVGEAHPDDTANFNKLKGERESDRKKYGMRSMKAPIGKSKASAVGAQATKTAGQQAAKTAGQQAAKKEVPLVKLGQGDYSKEYYGTKAGKLRRGR